MKNKNLENQLEINKFLHANVIVLIFKISRQVLLPPDVFTNLQQTHSKSKLDFSDQRGCETCMGIHK